MTAYLVRRVGQSIVVVIGVMILTFILIHMQPGDVARSVLGIRATATRISIFDATYGLNHPLWKQFIDYVNQVLHGNLGTSLYQQQPVATLFAQRLPLDVFLLGTSTALALVISVPMGVYQAVRRGRIGDNLLTGVTFTLYAMPAFWVGVMLIAAFAVQTHVFESTVPSDASVGWLVANPRTLALPLITLVIIQVAGFSRYMRSAVIDTLAQDYLRVARAKGLPERLVLSRHVLRNSLLPVVTVVGLSVPSLVTGAVVTETVFNIRGMGDLVVTAAVARDFPIVLGSTLLVGVATVVGNLAADIAYGILDPRVRYVRN